MSALIKSIGNETEVQAALREHPYVAQGFVLDHVGLHQLSTHGILKHSVMPCHGSHRESQESLHALSIFASVRLDSLLPYCSLDGCAPGDESELSCTTLRFRRGLLPTPGASEPEPAAPYCDGSDGPATMPLNRYVAPPTTLASDVLVRLEPDGTARVGEAALDTGDDASAADSQRLLISIHGFRPKDVDETHIRQMRMPMLQAVPFFRDSALLLYNIDRNQTTANLVARLRRYPQQTRWLVHSPFNLGYLLASGRPSHHGRVCGCVTHGSCTRAPMNTSLLNSCFG